MSIKGKSIVSCISLLAALLLVACTNSKTADNNDSSDSSSSDSSTSDAIKQGTSSDSAPDNAIRQGSWRSIAHSVQGSWYIVQNGAKLQVVFSNDFSTTGGPDLHLLLSPQEPSAVTSGNAATGAKKISALSSSPGRTFVGPVTIDIPEGTDLSLYKSIIIHCVTYSATWAVGTL